MPPRPLTPLRSAGVVALLIGGVAAQNTQPDVSTLFGGSLRDEISAVCRGDGDLITIVGQTNSLDLATTPGAAQAANAGGYDAFVARLDLSQAPANQLVWCTYVGGSGRDVPIDVEVGPHGIVTVVGSTESADFPGPLGAPPLARNGISDGFVVQLDPDGTTLISSMLVGGSGPDRLTDVEVEPSLEVVVAGVTESADLPWTAGTVSPLYQGGTDAFLARLSPPNAQGLWATYIGGSADEGYAFSTFVNLGGWPSFWEGFLDKTGLVVNDQGDIAITTVTDQGATGPQTTANALQSSHAGLEDTYLAVIDASGAALHYATFLGGNGVDTPMCMAAHPAGGFVLGGYTNSTNFPVTAGCAQPTFQVAGSAGLGGDVDGFVCHIDPAAGPTGLHYLTYLGGNRGQDAVVDLVVDPAGDVIATGYMVGGGTFPLTERSVLTGAGNIDYYGFVTKLRTRGNGTRDVAYSTRIGDPVVNSSWLNGLVVNDRGDVLVAGTTNATGFPTQNALQPTNNGDYDGCIVRMRLLPGCVSRSELATAVAACSAPLYAGMAGVPQPASTFSITATNAPPAALGIAVLGGAAPATSIPMPYNGTLLVQPQVLLTTISDALGGASVDLVIPASAPALCPWNLAAQWVFFTNASCPGSGVFATSARLQF